MYINIEGVVESTELLNAVIRNVNNVKEDITMLHNKVDGDILARRNIEERFRDIERRLQNNIEGFSKDRQFVFDAVDKYENCERLIQTYAEEVLYNINKRHENTISANASKFTTVKFGNRTIADRSLSIDKYISILKKLKDSITKITSPFLARIKKVKFNIFFKNRW